MDLQKITNSKFGVSFGLALGRMMPPKLGYRLAGSVAKNLAKRKESKMVKAVRINQYVVRGEKLTSEELDQAVIEVFTHAGRCFVDLYHNLQNPEGIKTLVLDSPRAQELIKLSRNRELGAFIVAPHVSNFDLALLSLAYRGLHAQVLTYGQPTGGYEIQNGIRASTGLDITPVSPEMHKKAIKNMRNGGFVVTAVDRPIRQKAHYLNFFGHPSPLPAGHIRMALIADVPLIVVSALMDNDGNYHIQFSDPLPIQRHDDPETEIRINGEAILATIEQRIRANPGQWLMYYPAWSEEILKGKL
jgi:lauroyl/myristoyl acyltransferase